MINYDDTPINNPILVNNKNKLDFKNKINIYDVNAKNLPRKKVLYGETYRSIRNERKSTEQLKLRKEYMNSLKNYNIGQPQTSRVNRNSMSISEKINQLKTIEASTDIDPLTTRHSKQIMGHTLNSTVQK
jgi:hypothetical protein